ncbi:PTS sugar transporter subunit IIA [Agromyces binzhouensis]|uniref:Ascorbate-specific PTS system EIIA component n=1 Tax=Agromyces binzhouensis TaxID=1817495 RepID=A0A4Q2JSU6_9MICO|nr:PTS sugar transporter subunit IIA [Agromyces binzhouensis]RXZ51461.1 PTS sugar transporter subunit IIA [Agromyces binzhouensis]
MSLPPLPDDAIVLRVDVADWRDAVRAAGRALARSGATLPGYADRMIDVLEEFGAYIVIAPGLALAHARPGPDVRRSGLAVVTLADPVAFGHPHNDPVRVVLGLAVSNAEEHVASVADLANVFNERDAIDRIAAAETPAEVRAVLRVADGQGRPATDAAGAPS